MACRYVKVVSRISIGIPWRDRVSSATRILSVPCIAWLLMESTTRLTSPFRLHASSSGDTASGPAARDATSTWHLESERRGVLRALRHWCREHSWKSSSLAKSRAMFEWSELGRAWRHLLAATTARNAVTPDLRLRYGLRRLQRICLAEMEFKGCVIMRSCCVLCLDGSAALRLRSAPSVRASRSEVRCAWTEKDAQNLLRHLYLICSPGAKCVLILVSGLSSLSTTRRKFSTCRNSVQTLDTNAGWSCNILKYYDY